MSLKSIQQLWSPGLKRLPNILPAAHWETSKVTPRLQAGSTKILDVKDRVMGCPSIYMNVNTYWRYKYMNISNRFLFNLYWYLLRCNILCFDLFSLHLPRSDLNCRSQECCGRRIHGNTSLRSWVTTHIIHSWWVNKSWTTGANLLIPMRLSLHKALDGCPLQTPWL